MIQAIRENDTIRARAFQKYVVTAGGAGMEEFRNAMNTVDTSPGIQLGDEVAVAMRDNILYNHGALKAKYNDLIEWGAKGAKTSSHRDITPDKTWSGLSNEDFALQHAKSQLQRLARALSVRSGRPT